MKTIKEEREVFKVKLTEAEVEEKNKEIKALHEQLLAKYQKTHNEKDKPPEFVPITEGYKYVFKYYIEEEYPQETVSNWIFGWQKGMNEKKQFLEIYDDVHKEKVDETKRTLESTKRMAEKYLKDTQDAIDLWSNPKELR